MRERGSAMLTAIVAIMVLLLISGVFFALVNDQFKLETSEEKGLKAYYLAESGINFAVVQVRNYPDIYFKEPYLSQSTKLPVDMPPFKDSYPGIADVYVQTDNTDSTNYIFTITSTGYYPDQNGIKRVLQEQYSFPKK